MTKKQEKCLVIIRTQGRDRIAAVKGYFQFVRENLQIIQISSVYEVAPPRIRVEESEKEKNLLGNINVAVTFFTDLKPHEIYGQMTEWANKKIVEAKEHVIIVDFLAYGDKVQIMPELTLPHPELHKRPDLFMPAIEIWPEYEHPILKKSLQEISTQVEKENWGEFFARSNSIVDFST